MIPIEVTARFDTNGNVVPLELVVRGTHYRVDSLGRRWFGAMGEHILVMVMGNRVMHLLFSAEKRQWFLLQDANQSIT